MDARALIGADLSSVEATRSVGHSARSRVDALIALQIELRALVGEDFAVRVGADNGVIDTSRRVALARGHNRLLEATRAIGHGLRRTDNTLVALDVVGSAGVGNDGSIGIGALNSFERALRSVASVRVHQHAVQTFLA